MSIAAIEDLDIQQMDVKTAFLNGILEEEIYMEQPEGYIESGKENQVCRLKKSLYGLKQSPREWNKVIDGYLKKQEMQPTFSDPCIYAREAHHGSLC
jgi:hypothetical protein